MTKQDKKTNEKKYTDEEKKDLMTAVALGFIFVFASLLALYVGFIIGRKKPRTPGIILGILGFMLLDEARRKSGSLKAIIKGALSDSPELTFESAQKEMEEFIKERDTGEEKHQKEM